jgi:hypothetical protein
MMDSPHAQLGLTPKYGFVGGMGSPAPSHRPSYSFQLLARTFRRP